MTGYSILIWAASRSGVFLALETGKGTLRALRKKGECMREKERGGQIERKKERKPRIDGERMNRQVEVASGYHIYEWALKFTTTPLTDRKPVPDTILHLAPARVSSLWNPPCRFDNVQN